MTQGYFRYPTIHKNTLVFVCEDDLWEISIQGGVPRRLTSGLGEITHPLYSPDGKWIAFCGTEEGHAEIYVIPAIGGIPRRLTYFGNTTQVVAWSQSNKIIFSTPAKQAFGNLNHLYEVSPTGGPIIQLKVGPANFISYDAKGKGCVLQRHGYREFGFWKRYRGGTAGQLWLDRKGTSDFHHFLQLKSDLARPLWIKDRIYFLSDHDGIGNIYSSTLDAKKIRQETFHKDFYVRNHATDGRHIVYHAGGDLYVYNIQEREVHKINLTYPSPRSQRARRYISARDYIQDYHLHPHGHHITLTSRGKAYAFAPFEGPVRQLNTREDVRIRLSTWLSDGKRIISVSDEEEDESLEIIDALSTKKLKKIKSSKLGRILSLKASPVASEVVLTNHKNELIYVNCQKGEIKILDRSAYSMIEGVDWSPDGEWIVYNCSHTRHTSLIKLVHKKTRKVKAITRPVLRDVRPTFDKEGKYIYFLSYREFEPSWDTLHFELGFPLGIRPYLITLQKELTNPFMDLPESLATKEKKEKESKKEKTLKKIKVDLDGIENRIIAFPLPNGLYQQIKGLKGKVYFTHSQVRGSSLEETEEEDYSTLSLYDFESKKTEDIAFNVKDFSVSSDGQMLIYRDWENDLRVFKVGEKPEESHDAPRQKRGWINLKRVKVSVSPHCEWRQIFDEAWRLQRDHFWTEDMSKIDWEKVYKRYHPLVEKVGTRGELSDLIWEMQGELGTSHAYVIGGDRRQPPQYSVGFLGADFEYNKAVKGYKIIHINQGDPWNPLSSSPLRQAGINVSVGDFLLAINGQLVTQEKSPEFLLVNKAEEEVSLTILSKNKKSKQDFIVRTLKSDRLSRYRDWVEHNRTYVHTKTKGRVGYLHIPDMSVRGYSEFHRYFLVECERDGLIIDVRFNGGGSVSPLILEKLARKRLGYDLTRWFGSVPYPEDSPAGPMVALTNEYAGSDGDMFSHGFKILKLGPLIGKRTWGGVIGYWPRYSLVDRGITTQPEFSFWFNDVGWKIENYGVDPDIEVEMRPQDYVKGIDPQLDRSITEALTILKKKPVQKPSFKNRPNLKLKS